MLVGTRNGQPRMLQETPPPVTPPLPLVPGTIALQRRNPLRIRLHQPVPRRLIARRLPNRRTLCPQDLQPTITRPRSQTSPYIRQTAPSLWKSTPEEDIA